MQRSTWLDDAVATCALRGTAWTLLRQELYENLAALLASSHPTLVDAAIQEQELAPSKAIAMAQQEAEPLLLSYQSIAMRQRLSVGYVGWLASAVLKAAKKLKALGQKNLRHQLLQARAAREREKAAHKAKAESDKAARRAKHAARREKAEAKAAEKAAAKAKTQDSGDSATDDDDDDDEDDSDDEEDDEEDDSATDDDDDSASEDDDEDDDDEEEDDDDDDENDSEEDGTASSGRPSTATPSEYSESAASSTGDPSLKPLRSHKHQPKAPGTEHAEQRRRLMEATVHLEQGYERAGAIERQAFGSGWNANIVTLLSRQLEEQASEREKLHEAATNPAAGSKKKKPAAGGAQKKGGKGGGGAASAEEAAKIKVGATHARCMHATA